MGLATFNGRAFRIDPTTVSWEFQLRVNVVDTVGGRVVQVYGSGTGDMNITGQFGVGGWQEQTAFLEQMKALADAQAAKGAIINQGFEPVRFTYAPKGWDFLVYLKDFIAPDVGTSVGYDNRIINPKWNLTLLVVENNLGLSKAAQDAFIARISAGIGWQQTKFNGPMDASTVQDTLAGQSITQFLDASFGVATQTPTGATG